MGREIRKVPADWQHPRYTAETATRTNQVGQFIPMHDQDYETACEEWLNGLDLWRKGEHPDQQKGYGRDYKYFWQWNGNPPDAESYRERKWTPEEATHFVVYETVSEGTPVTPAFATPEELVEYLATKGTFWDSGKGWNRTSAERFVAAGWAPSGIAVVGEGFKTVDQAGFCK